MPFVTTDDGVRHYVPGVYTSTKVSSSIPGPLPAFHVPILLARGWDGHPYNADDLVVSGEALYSPFKLLNTDSAAADYFGENSDLHHAMQWGKRHGLPFAYCVCLSPLTRASIIAETVGNVSQYTLFPKAKFGPMGGWIKIGQTAGGVVTTIPVKRYAPLAANLGATATRMTFARAHGWLAEGAEVIVGSNIVLGVARTILRTGVEVQANGQLTYWAELSSSVGTGCATADFAVVLQYATERTVISRALGSVGQALIDYFNDESSVFRAVIHANYTGALPATVATPTAIKDLGATWGTFTTGTAPAVTDADVTAFVARLNAGDWDQFLVREQLIPQTYCLADSDVDRHATMRDYSIAERIRGYGVSVTTGCAWGDHVIAAGDTTDPTFRSAALNSQDVMLAAGGLDYEAACMSLAPAIWARRVAGGPGHNLTNDELIFTALERKWNEINLGELTALSKKGVTTYKLSVAAAGFRYRVSEGLSTLQANSGLIWNVSDATTWAVMQRDLADFVDRVIKTDFEEQIIGASKVDANAIATVLNRRAEKSLVARGYIKSFSVTSITLNEGANGYIVRWAVKLPDTVDFMTFETTILIGEA